MIIALGLYQGFTALDAIGPASNSLSLMPSHFIVFECALCEP